jgi:hypothetical protein
MTCKANGFEVKYQALALFFLCALSAFPAKSESVKLGWDASPDASAVGYNIYYGTASHSYTSKITLGNVTSATVSGLTAGTTYFFAATTYNSTNQESDFSNEASYAVPLPVNQPPTLNTLGNVSINQNAGIQGVSLTGITSGSSTEIQTLKVTAVSSNPNLIPTPSIAYTSPNTTGSLRFQPVSNVTGTATISVTVNDGGSTNSTITRSFTVTVNAVNQMPTLNTLSGVSINENAGVQSVALTGITSGLATEIQTLKVTAVSSNPNLIPAPSIAYTSPTTTGSLTFQPASNATGTATISVTVDDGGAINNKITRSFTVTVNAIKQTPTLNPLSNVVMNENAPSQTIALSGITSGLTTGNPTLKITVTSSKTSLIHTPTLVYTSPNSTGSITFKPANNATGTATISVTVNNGAKSDSHLTRTFIVTVNRTTNQPPTLNALSDVAINENVPWQTIALAGISSGSPNEDQSLKITVASSKTSLIPTPTLNYASPNSTGFLTFKPVNNAVGMATISVTISDGGTSNSHLTRTFNVTVNRTTNQPPTLNALGNVVINEDASSQTIALTGITSGSVNEDQPLKITVTSSKNSLIPTPKLIYTGPDSTGSLIFKPATSTSGTATISVTVNDGGTTNNIITRSFTVTVNPNLPPTLNALENVVVDENMPPHTINLTGITSGSVNENQTLKVTVASSKTSLIPTPTLVYASPGSTGSLTFKPANNATGTATLSVTVNDGGTRSNRLTRTFLVTVNRTTNQPPTLNALSDVAVAENVPSQTIALTGISSGSPNEDQSLKISITSSKTSLIPTPTIVYTSPNSTGSLIFKPVKNSDGTATITVTVNDGGTQNKYFSRSFTVTVYHVNVPPTLDPISDVTFNEPPTLDPISDFVVNKNAGWQTVSLTGISSGDAVENQKLTVKATSNNTTLIPNPTIKYASSNSFASLLFKPASNQTGTAGITVSITDDGTPKRTVTQTFAVTVLGTTPVSSGFPVITGLTATNSAIAGDNLTFSVAALGKSHLHYQWKFNGSDITFATNAVLFLNHVDVSQSGDYSVMIFNHYGTTNSAAVTLAVSASLINPPPLTATANFDPSILTQTIPLTGISDGSSREHQTLTVQAVSSNPNLIPDPTVSYVSSKSSGSITFSPVKNANGTANISVTVNDGCPSNNIITRTFSVTVNPITVASSTATSKLAASMKTTDAVNSISDSVASQDAAPQPVPQTGILSENLAANQNAKVEAIASNPVWTANLAAIKSITSNSTVSSNSVTDATVALPPIITLVPAGFVNGQFSLSISGGDSYQCVVQASTNLVDWMAVETNTTPFVFIDYDAGQFEHRYYRTVGKEITP